MKCQLLVGKMLAQYIQISLQGGVSIVVLEQKIELQLNVTLSI
jgi:hypothetical protein